MEIGPGLCGSRGPGPGARARWPRHLDREGRRDDRDDQTKRERDTAGELGEGRDPGPEPWGPHTHTRDALSPARKARASPHAQNFLRSVCRDDETDNGTHERECEIG